MDRSAALLERAKNVQVRDREIEEIIVGLQSISLEPHPAQRPVWYLIAGMATTFIAGLVLESIICL